MRLAVSLELGARSHPLAQRDGDIVTQLGFSAYDKEIDIGLCDNFDINAVISFFNQSGKVTFSNEPDKYYKFAQYNGIDFEKLVRYKTAKVAFHVQPFKYALNYMLWKV